MPWKVAAVSDVRFALCHAVRTLHRPVAVAAREFGVSRKTAHKWLAVFDDALGGGGGDAVTAAALADRSRRPIRSPGRTPDDVERRVLAVRDRYHWGPRKVRAFLLQEARRRGEPAPQLPSVRTLGAILARHGRVAPVVVADPPPVQRFERDAPNQLWQVDHKGPFEVARRPVTPLTVIDDHSRYCPGLPPHPGPDHGRRLRRRGGGRCSGSGGTL